MPEINLGPDILGIRRIEYFFLLPVNHICTGNNAQQIGGEIQVPVKIKIVPFTVGPVLCIEVVIINRPDNELAFQASGQDDIGIERQLKCRIDMGRVYKVNPAISSVCSFAALSFQIYPKLVLNEFSVY